MSYYEHMHGISCSKIKLALKPSELASRISLYTKELEIQGVACHGIQSNNHYFVEVRDVYCVCQSKLRVIAVICKFCKLSSIH